jgi:hypothetical protein
MKSGTVPDMYNVLDDPIEDPGEPARAIPEECLEKGVLTS